jgi:hypothetical protein
MDASTVLRTNGAKAGEFVGGVIGGAADAVAKAWGEMAVPLGEMIERKAETLAKTVEVRAVPLAETAGMTVETLAKTVESRAAPIAEAVGATAGSVAEDVSGKIERTGESLAAGIKNFKFGRREGLILGLTLGLFAAVWVFTRVDRRAAARTLRGAGSRVGDATQGLTSRMGQAAQGLPGKASALAGQAGDRAGQVGQVVGTRVNQVVQQVRRGQGDQMVEDARSRLTDGTETMRGDAPKNGGSPKAAEKPKAEAASDLDKDTQAAINEAAEEARRVEDEALEAAQKLGLSNGMKVVAFDGTDLGRVQEVRERGFVLDRPKGSDLLVPLTEVARIEGTVAYLRIDVGQLTKMGWDQA